ncbi:gap junction alpha-6 protein-like [Carassius carassius]|uniref:gap junction alpha-6 protein-like n=1 Tax=Carassius carassius TaxID=217509 RepID=UPI00286885A5|nr:gap junction alpha-6 protein-like [Carassius carassius]XP_059365663.1 gap junction alpha-6 protein-like [Carassius carassius]
MSRADWGFLEHLLEEGQEYSTGVGRVWLTVLFLFRMLVLGTAVESAWDDEQSDFVCNTKQPGCESVCYDKAFPISHFRFFVLQVIFVSAPTIFYFGYVALRTRNEKRSEGKPEEEGRTQRHSKTNEFKLEVIREEDEVSNEKEMEKNHKPQVPSKIKGKLLCAYATSLVLKILIEIGFILGLWILYGFVIKAKYECERFPCPHTVDCFVSRPTEKTIFTIYTQVIAAVSVLLNVVELLHLLQLAVNHRLEKRYQCEEEINKLIRATSSRKGSARAQIPSFEGKKHLFLPVAHDGYPTSGLDWDKRDPPLTEDMIPSYIKCMNNVKSAITKNNLHKKHHRTEDKLRHYV